MLVVVGGMTAEGAGLARVLQEPGEDAAAVERVRAGQDGHLEEALSVPKDKETEVNQMAAENQRRMRADPFEAMLLNLYGARPQSPEDGQDRPDPPHGLLPANAAECRQQ